jgi:PilZ domain
MSEMRKYVRFHAEFPATFAGDHTGVGIVYNLGLGGCKIVSDQTVKSGALLSVHLKIPEQTTAITIRAATVHWIMDFEFGVEFLEMQALERDRLEQFLATQVNIVP